MERYIRISGLIIFLCLMIVACTRISGRGEEGGNCFFNGSCNKGLMCNRETWICEKWIGCYNCSENAFECKPGYGNCNHNWKDGCETELNKVNRCGTDCNNTVVCSSVNGSNPVCENGICRLTCNPEYTDCNAKPGFSDGCEKKIDEKHIWSKSFGGSGYDTGRLVAIDSSNDIYLAGEFESASIEFGSNKQKKLGEQDIFLAKFDSNGNHLWSKRFGGNDNDQGYSVSVDSSGNVYGTGFFVGDDTDFGLCPLPNQGGGDIYLIKYKP